MHTPKTHTPALLYVPAHWASQVHADPAGVDPATPEELEPPPELDGGRDELGAAAEEGAAEEEGATAEEGAPMEDGAPTDEELAGGAEEEGQALLAGEAEEGTHDEGGGSAEEGASWLLGGGSHDVAPWLEGSVPLDASTTPWDELARGLVPELPPELVPASASPAPGLVQARARRRGNARRRPQVVVMNRP
jgi:hypothetical protein